MKIKLNPDRDIVKLVKRGLAVNGGYCPCRTERTEDTRCICTEFRKQLEDPNFSGYCRCLLYRTDD